MQNLAIDKSRTAVLIMDYQNEIVSGLPQDQQKPLLLNAAKVLEAARRAQLPVIYVAVRFRPGYPEISPRNKTFKDVKASGRLREGTPAAEIHSEVAPHPEDVIVIKRRVGAFSNTDMTTVLGARGITTLVLMGIITSGVVLSTVRWAADMDYEMVVIADGCADRDAEVHRVLMEKLFPRQAAVVTAQDFIAAVAK